MLEELEGIICEAWMNPTDIVKEESRFIENLV